ncbi:MAG: prepilin-type N-terminal cleavage/methylation domain-containing protein, partial [Deltaproteobacteria bacterium]|nr:prepilin-type N-terminal cleavage/methylation domain-containing protein [Deltaproteobacteria bacterium]
MKNAVRGFTLIEVLLAILIGSLLLTTIYGIFSSVSNVRNQLEREGEAFHQVRIFFDRIGGELSS